MNNKQMLSDMLVFAEVASARSYTAAAKHLNQSKSSVSQQVKRLEAALNEQLLIRNTRGMALTSSGEALLRRCEIIRSQFDLAKKEIVEQKEEPSGRFAVTYPIACEQEIVIPAIEQLCIEYPKLVPDLYATDQVKDLIQDEFDVALYIGTLKDSHYRVVHIDHVEEAFFASSRYIQKFGKPKQLADLANHKIIELPWHQKEPLLNFDKTKNLNICSNNLHGALDMTSRGMGICILPTILTKSLMKEGAIEQVLKDVRGTSKPFSLVHRYPSIKPPHLERFELLVKLHFGQLM